MLDRPYFGREIEIEGSTLVRSVQYDPGKWVLDVTLHSGDRYRYREIGPREFADMVATKSAGKAFNKIKMQVGDGCVTVRKLQPST